MVFKACSVGLLKYDKKTIQNLSNSNSSHSSEENKESQNNMHDEKEVSSSNSNYEVIPYMKKLISLGINEKDNYNEYRFGNIIISKQIDFLHYFWLAISLCHEVISISENKQKLKKAQDNNMFLFHEPVEPSKKKNYNKKLTYDKKVQRKLTVKEEEAKDDFDVVHTNKLLANDQISENNNDEEQDQIEEEKDEIDSLSEMDIEEDDKLIYHGMSPDEITLVDAAKDVGFEFRFRSNKVIEIRIAGEKKLYNLLKVFAFTSERKRMTVIVQDPTDLEYAIAFTKGADNVMKALSLEQYSGHFEHKYLDQFAKKGFRTLIVGMKIIRYDEFKEWEEAYDDLNKDLENDHSEELEQLVYLIEKDLFLLGTTALEDKLQENVHE